MNADTERNMTDATLGTDGAPAHPNPQGRDARGRFRKGNGLAVTHALHAIELPPELRHLRDEITTYEAACLVDEGDIAANVPVRRRSLLTYRARLHRRFLQIDDAIELRGLIDRRGRLRVVWLTKLESLIGAAVRVDTLLGLQRRPKHVDVATELQQLRREQEMQS